MAVPFRKVTELASVYSVELLFNIFGFERIYANGNHKDLFRVPQPLVKVAFKLK